MMMLLRSSQPGQHSTAQGILSPPISQQWQIDSRLRVFSSFSACQLPILVIFRLSLSSSSVLAPRRFIVVVHCAKLDMPVPPPADSPYNRHSQAPPPSSSSSSSSFCLSPPTEYYILHPPCKCSYTAGDKQISIWERQRRRRHFMAIFPFPSPTLPYNRMSVCRNGRLSVSLDYCNFYFVVLYTDPKCVSGWR